MVSTVAGGFVVFTRSLLFSSAKAAQNYKEYSKDPMNELRKRFKNFTKQLADNNIRLVVLIDDVDRCESEYVVSLLEGIQTLFKHGSIIFVIAADRRWLHSCFEQKYDKFKDTVHEPGKPLGNLFLEKTFQLCAPIPDIPKQIRLDYWNQMLALKREEIKAKIKKAGEECRKLITRDMGEYSLEDIVEKSEKDKTIFEQLAIREQAVMQLATPKEEERTEHTLKPFVQLLDNNPRSWKRLVNAYSTYRAIATLTFIKIEMEDLAQWTVLSLRWPQLAEYLAEHPELVSMIGKDKLTGVDEEIQYLFRDEGVATVITGKVKGVKITRTALSEDVIKECAKLM
jgi:hypothetical protein